MARIGELDATPEEVCRDCPELLDEVRRRWEELRAFDAEMSTLFEQPAPGAPDGAGRSADVVEFTGYEIETTLGQGGMGVVYRARESSSGRIVALKVIHPHLRRLPGFVERLRREADLGRRVVHENVVRTFGLASDVSGVAARQALVTEFVEGQTLRSLLGEMGHVPEQLCRHIGREIANGLDAIHAAGAVHRDLKPENVLITPGHVVKVMDLGVARVLDLSDRLSHAGAFVGSLRYAAPEQLRGGAEIDRRADLFALGLVLFELATGRHALDRDPAKPASDTGRRAPQRRASELQPQLSPFFDELLACLLAEDRDARPHDAAVVASTLDQGEVSAWWRTRSLSLPRAEAPPRRPFRVPHETSMVGRAEDLASLLALCERARSGDGQVVLIQGEGGVGKSRLLDEWVEALGEQDVHVLVGAHAPGGAATATGAFSSAYRDHLGAERIGEALRRHLRDSPALVAGFGALLRGEPPPAGAEPLTKDSLQTAFVRTTQSLATERLTVVLIDDLQFAPAEGRALFSALAVAVQGHRVVLAGTARRALDAAWSADLARLPHASRITLRRLAAEDVVALLRLALGPMCAAEELASPIARMTDGNPHFVLEILRELRSAGHLQRDPDGTWLATRPIREIPIPCSIRDLVQARFNALSADDRELLHAAACAGAEFDPLLVGDALGVERLPLLRRLGTLETVHRLVRSEGRLVAFEHHVVQEVIYTSMSEVHREALHARLAEALLKRTGFASSDPATWDGRLCVDLELHLFRGGRASEALRYLRPALDHLERTWQQDATAGLLERTLAVPGLVDRPARCELLLRLAAARDLLGRPADEERALDEANETADALGEQTLMARARSARAAFLMRTSPGEQAIAAGEVAIDLFRRIGDRTGEANAIRIVGATLSFLGRHVEALPRLSRCKDLAHEVGDRRVEAAARLGVGGVLLDTGNLERAREEFEASLGIAVEIGDRRIEGRAHGMLGSLLHRQGRLEEARARYQAMGAVCREIGDRSGEAQMLANAANIAWSQGLYGQAHSLSRRSVVLNHETGFRRSEAFAETILGMTIVLLGDGVEALPHLERGCALARDVGYRTLAADSTLLLAATLEDLGRSEEALRTYERAIAESRESEYLPGAADSMVCLGALLVELGRPTEAIAHVDEALALSAGAGTERSHVVAAAQRAVLPGGDPAAAVALFKEHGRTLSVHTSMVVRQLLWQATGDIAHLAEAKRLLDHVVEHAPPDRRKPMVENVQSHRKIAEAACRCPELSPVSRID